MGGYLIHQWYPERRVFTDGRMNMYGNAIVDYHLQVANAWPRWAGILDRYGIQTVPGSPRTRLSPPLSG